jgi:hypothetical protein
MWFGRLPTAAARVLAQVRSCGMCGRQCGTGAGFLRVLRFPLPSISSIIQGWYNQASSGHSNSEFGSTPLHKGKIKLCD